MSFFLLDTLHGWWDVLGPLKNILLVVLVIYFILKIAGNSKKPS